uniref:Uncharacterized protein n=1 Tax=Micrurus spixii TaxID=129469 RepID=A0A2D4M822_9SAUR
MKCALQLLSNTTSHSITKSYTHTFNNFNLCVFKKFSKERLGGGKGRLFLELLDTLNKTVESDSRCETFHLLGKPPPPTQTRLFQLEIFSTILTLAISFSVARKGKPLM